MSEKFRITIFINEQLRSKLLWHGSNQHFRFINWSFTTSLDLNELWLFSLDGSLHGSSEGDFLTGICPNVTVKSSGFQGSKFLNQKVQKGFRLLSLFNKWSITVGLELSTNTFWPGNVLMNQKLVLCWTWNRIDQSEFSDPHWWKRPS